MRPLSGKAPLALGLWLAARGPAALAAFMFAALEAVGAAVAAYLLARGGGGGAHRVPAIAAEGIAWTAGISLAFGAAWGASHRDREEGILALVRARGSSVGAYVRGRVGGLVILLSVTVGGATLVSALAATSAASAPLAAVRSGASALAYALAFAATLGPVTMAALGARSRLTGYLSLLVVLAVPELVAPWTSGFLPPGWSELTSIPAALDARREAVAAPIAMAAHGARAFAVLATVVAVSLVVVDMRAARIDLEPAS